VLLGGTQQFTAVPNNVTWAVDGVEGGNEIVGTISPSGLYTAPAVVPFNTILAIKASSNSVTYALLNVGALSGTRFAYISSAIDNSIQVFRADGNTGALEPISTFAVGAGSAPAALALSPNGKFLFSLNRGTNEISIYAIDAATGNLSNAGSVPVPKGPNSMVFSASGDFAYVGCDSSSMIAAYVFNRTSGSLTPLEGGSYSTGGGRIESLAISPDGLFLYGVNRDANQIVGLSIDHNNGSLTPVTGSPFSAPPGLSSIVANKPSTISSWHVFASSDAGVETYDHTRDGGLVYVNSGTRTTGVKSPTLFRNTSDGVLVGVNPLIGGAFSLFLDDFGSNGLDQSVTAVNTGISPVAGAWMWNDNGYSNWIYILNQQASQSSSTGSINVYQVDWDHGLVGPSATIATELHNPTGFVVTP
jgi:hypothetical protein